MTTRFASLGSGSSGNAMLIQSGETTVMLDCGFSCKETVKRLNLLNVDPGDIDAIVVTHEHHDHLGGVGVFSRRYKTPVWMSYGTAQVERIGKCHQTHILSLHQTFDIGELSLEPFPVPHDANEPVQFVFCANKKKLGIFTDAGHVTAHIRTVLSELDALVIESNHDLELLNNGSYSPSLKKRVAGPYGHLNNHQAAKLAFDIHHNNLQHLITAHLSKQNNTPGHVEETFLKFFSSLPEGFEISTQEVGFDWRSLD
jgi:phosphoribosyl 1,2-cyclic phosphodiesterase